MPTTTARELEWTEAADKLLISLVEQRYHDVDAVNNNEILLSICNIMRRKVHLLDNFDAYSIRPSIIRSRLLYLAEHPIKPPVTVAAKEVAIVEPEPMATVLPLPSVEPKPDAAPKPSVELKAMSLENLGRQLKDVETAINLVFLGLDDIKSSLVDLNKRLDYGFDGRSEDVTAPTAGAKRICIIGGQYDSNQAQRLVANGTLLLDRRHWLETNNRRLIRSARNVFQSGKVDVVLFFTKCLGHSIYRVLKAECNRLGIPHVDTVSLNPEVVIERIAVVCSGGTYSNPLVINENNDQSLCSS